MWDDLAFRERVMEAAKARGIDTLKEVARLARLDPKYFREDRPNMPDGRNVRHVMQIAEALDSDPAYLLGLTDSPTEPKVSTDSLDRVAFVSSIAAHLYVAMARRRTPDQVDAHRLAKMVVELLDFKAGSEP